MNNSNNTKTGQKHVTATDMYSAYHEMCNNNINNTCIDDNDDTKDKTNSILKYCELIDDITLVYERTKE